MDGGDRLGSVWDASWALRVGRTVIVPLRLLTCAPSVRVRGLVSGAIRAGGLASSTTPAHLEALLPHLFASGFSHPLIDSFLRLGLPMTFPRGIDWSAATARDRGGGRYRRCFSL
jgi:hypothetical protein